MSNFIRVKVFFKKKIKGRERENRDLQSLSVQFTEPSHKQPDVKDYSKW